MQYFQYLSISKQEREVNKEKKIDFQLWLFFKFQLKYGMFDSKSNITSFIITVPTFKYWSIINTH
jgi:hypothetical protein